MAWKLINSNVIITIIGGVIAGSGITIYVAFDYFKGLYHHLRALSYSFDAIQIITILLVFLVLIIATLLLIRTKKEYFVNKILQLRQQINEQKKIAASEKFDAIKDHKFLEYILTKSIQDFSKNDKIELSPEHINKFQKYFMVAPFSKDFLIRIKDHDYLVLYAMTTIKISDVKGTKSNLDRKLYLVNLGRSEERFIHGWDFSKGNIIESIHTEGSPNRISELNNHECFKLPMQRDIEKFKIENTDIELSLKDCFINETEYWEPNNEKYPIIWERIKIIFKKKPSKIWYEKTEGDTKLAITQDDLVELDSGENHGEFKLDVLLNYQHYELSPNMPKCYSIKWIP
ncbi:hypothetical protein [Reichenbachiella faecimaris]|uniref:hypothetical protein n=1 Tax=Reichenbachiella faecimaris TaxID=692418 RepID=UPI00111BD76C|nr:hypothetical protein [Reichenbachiella faecimaris]